MTTKTMNDSIPQSSNGNNTSITTVAALIQAYAKGERNFSTISLVAADLNGVDLKGADLSYADFSDANLRKTNLRGADLSYARLCNAQLSEADLRGAMIIGTDLREAQLTSTLLQEADYDPKNTHFPTGFKSASAGMRADR